MKKFISVIIINFLFTLTILCADNSTNNQIPISDQDVISAQTQAIKANSDKITSESLRQADELMREMDKQMDQRIQSMMDDDSIFKTNSSSTLLNKKNLFNNLPDSDFPQIKYHIEDNKCLIQLIVPGMNKENLEVRTKNNLINITGKYNASDKRKKGNSITETYQHLTKEFNQTLTLPQNADSAKITSSCKDGILSIEIPLKKEKIAVNQNSIPIN